MASTSFSPLAIDQKKGSISIDGTRREPFKAKRYIGGDQSDAFVPVDKGVK
jgi:hypothetical protein